MKFGGFLTELGVKLRVMIFRLRTVRNLKQCPVCIGDCLFALDMSSNVTHCSNLYQSPSTLECILSTVHVVTLSRNYTPVSVFTVHPNLCDPPHVDPRHPRCPRLLQYRHLHCRLVPPECRQLYQISHPPRGSSCGFLNVGEGETGKKSFFPSSPSPIFRKKKFTLTIKNKLTFSLKKKRHGLSHPPVT
jgi:hypothetical protein